MNQTRLFYGLCILCIAHLGACTPSESSDPPQNTQNQNSGIPAGCDAAALAAMCPPGSSPLTGTDAFDACQGRSDVQITDNTGAISGICEGQGACLVICNLQNPCTCGIERVTDEGIFCVPCELSAACGNAVCEGGENPETCPVDCAAECFPEQGRCDGGDLQLCQNNGSWKTLPCRSDQRCAVGKFSPSTAFCQTALSPSGGTEPNIVPAPVLETDPTQIAALESQILCAGDNPQACMPLGIVQGTQILVKGLMLYDPFTEESREFPNTGGTAGPQMGYNRDHVGWCAGRQVRVLDLNTGATQNMAAFVDDTIPLECGAVSMNRENTLIAASMKLENAPMVAIWDSNTGELLHLLRFADPELGVSSAAVSVGLDASGKWLVECRNPDDQFNGTPLMVVWNVEEGRYVRLLQFEGVCGRSTLRPGHFQVLQGGTLWNLEDGMAQWSLRGVGDPRAAVSPDGSAFAMGWMGECGGCTAIVDAESGLALRFLGGLGERAFSEDGRYLLSGSYLYDADF